MLLRRLIIAASLWLAASLPAGGGVSAWAATADELAVFNGRWEGKIYLDCNGVYAPIEVVIEDGEMIGETKVRGMGQGDSNYHVSGYIDRKGRISDGRISGVFGFTMDGRLSDGVGKGRFRGTHCRGDWKFTQEDAPPPPSKVPPSETQTVTASAPSKAPPPPEIDATPPVIEAPAMVETERPVFELSGRVSDGSKIIEFTLNGAAAPLQADGSFYFTRGAALGDSELVITALDEWGNEAEQRVRIRRSEPAKAPVEPPATEQQDAVQTAALGRQVDDGTAPRIQMPPKLVTDGSDIEITGSVWDESAITDLFVNERRFALRPDGSFAVRQRLKIGINKFAFSAIDEWGNKSVKRIDVERKRLDLALGTYHALVIGNNDYGDLPKLNTAVADAEAVSQVLAERYGFSVTTLINATRYDVIGAMSELRANLSYDTNLLIYYAGHGIVDPVTERGYWLPVDADRDNPANWVSNDDITDMVKAIPARHILVIADSCYSGTLVRSAPLTLETWEDRRAWLKRIADKRSRTALASGGLEPVADAGSGGHSVFAQALLGALRENSEIIEAQALFAPVRKSVVLNANQTPVYSDIRMAGHDGGDFVFSPK